MADITEQAQAHGASSGEDFILDAWTALSFKRALGERRMGGVSWASPGWVGTRNVRRLIAYKIRHAYYENAARHMLPNADPEKRKNHREYGDAALLVETIRSALLGDEQTIVVPGADDAEPDTQQQQQQTRKFLPRLFRRKQQPDQTDEQTQARRAKSLQDQLRKWGDDERLPLKLIETERNACKLADGVYVLGWNAKKERVRLRCYDPGFYFPVLDDGNDDEFPVRVHIAYEVDDDSTPMDDTKVRVRRITWELRDMTTVQPIDPGTPAPTPLDLPWNDSPTTIQCYMSDGVWTIEKTGTDVDDFTEGQVKWNTMRDDAGNTVEIRHVPLGIDFLPVVHVPNTVALQAHFGSGVLDRVLQILDDLAGADTDLQQASALAGFPPLALAKATLASDKSDTDGVRITTYGPGTVFEVGEGNLTPLDMSGALSALIEYVNHLLSRLEVNGRVTAGALGRVKASDFSSGVHLALSFGPMRTMIDEMRTVRNEKYRLVLRFVTRFMWLMDKLDDEPPEAEAELEFGAFLPADKQEAVTAVTSLLQANAISIPTALRILVDAGFPIEDAAEEVLAIQAEDFTGANELLNATDDLQLVRDYLGIAGTPPAPPPPPTPVIPPQPPQPPGGPQPPQPAPQPGQ